MSMIVYDGPEASACLRASDAEERVTMERGSGMMRTWSVLVPSFLHYPHTYLTAAAPYYLVLLVDTKKLEQQRRKLSEPASAYVCHVSLPPFHTFGWQDIFGHSCSLRSPWPDGQTLEWYLSIHCPCHPESTDGPHTYFITPTTTSACEDVKNYVKICVAHSPTVVHPMWRRPQYRG